MDSIRRKEGALVAQEMSPLPLRLTLRVPPLVRIVNTPDQEADKG